MQILIMPCKNYSDSSDCGIAKGLKRKWIFFNIVSPDTWFGFFLGFIPISGKIPKLTNIIAHQSDKIGFKSTAAYITIRIGWIYN